MKLLLLFIALFSMIVGISPAYGQSLRNAGDAGARGWSAQAAPANPSVSRQQSAPTLRGHSSGVTVRQHGPLVQPPAPGRPSISSGLKAVVVPSTHGWQKPPKRFDRRRHPHRPHSHPHHVHPGVVFFDGPWSYGTTTVITEVAPGVVQADRRYADEAPGAIPGRGEDRLAPFDPTPHEVVERMLRLAGLKRDDVVYDLGSGDGRILIAAAKKYGARGVGYEIDPGLVKLARENVRQAGVEKLVEIREEDFLDADLSPATAVTLYLSYDGNLAVREQLNDQLKPGARVVSYTFDMADWRPKVTESYRDAAGNVHSLYLWEVGRPAFAQRSSQPLIEPYPSRQGPLIIDVN